MPVKIKINWDNENVVSESVRIYRADSIFTPTSLPPLLAEIMGDMYEYEDLTTVENQTYFYMLSAKLGEQEVFTECYEVVAELPINYLQFEIVLSSRNNVGLHAVNNQITVYESITDAKSVNILIMNAPGVSITAPGWTQIGTLGNLQYFYRIGSIYNRATVIESSANRFLGYGIFNLKCTNTITEVVTKTASVAYSSPAPNSVINMSFPAINEPINADGFVMHYWAQGATDGSAVSKITPAGYIELPSMNFPNGSSAYSTGFSGFGKLYLKGEVIDSISAQFTNVYSGTYWCHTIQICAKG